MQTIKRRDKLPSVFCGFPWVREGQGAFADCEADRKLVALYQAIANEKADVSELDEPYSLTLAVKIPETIRQATGDSGRGFGPVSYYWNVYDLVYLLKGTRPSGAVPLEVAGFAEDGLIALAKLGSYLSHVRSLEQYAGGPKGSYFPSALEKELKDFEGRQSSRVKIWKKVIGLRGSRVNSDIKVASHAVPEKTRNEVLSFHAYTCVFDGRTRPEFPMHVHHVIPRKWIERLSLPERLFVGRENLVAACSGCNIAKTDELSRADVRFYLQQFSSADHPNYPLVPLLEKLRSVQDEGATLA